MTPSARALARGVLPGRAYDAASFSARRLRARRIPDNRAVALDREFVRQFGLTVRSGPFAGLAYDARMVGATTAVGAKLLGAYEQELHGAVEGILSSDMPAFVDIGSAEGYYAVGVALTRRDVPVIAFDIDGAARHMCRLLQGANGVSIDLRSEATSAFLAGLEPGTVVFSDCEGAEGHLLDPARAPALSGLRIIVELHDFIQPRLSTLIRERFAPTHSVVEVATADRQPAAYPELSRFSEADGQCLLSEGRPAAMSWLVMDPLADPVGMPASTSP